MLQPIDEMAIKERTKHKFKVQSLCVDDDFADEGLDTVVRFTTYWL